MRWMPKTKKRKLFEKLPPSSATSQNGFNPYNKTFNRNFNKEQKLKTHLNYLKLILKVIEVSINHELFSGVVFSINVSL